MEEAAAEDLALEESTPGPATSIQSATQFSLGALLILIALCACVAACLRFLSSLPGWERRYMRFDLWFSAFLLICMLGATLGGWMRCVRRVGTYGKFAWATLTLFGLNFALIMSGLSIWHLGQAGASGIVWFMAFLMMIWGWVMVVGEFRSCTVGNLLLFGLLLPTVFVPQTRLLVRFKDMQREVTSVASYLEAEKQTHGVYPATLSGYTFVAPRWQSLFDCEPTELHDDYALNVKLTVSDSTDRSYTPNGGWYFPN